jgi:hypothetical protein
MGQLLAVIGGDPPFNAEKEICEAASSVSLQRTRTENFRGFISAPAHARRHGD